LPDQAPAQLGRGSSITYGSIEPPDL